MVINILPNYASMSDGVSIEYVPSGFNLGVGISAPNEKLTVGGKLSIQETTAPSLTAGYGKVYVDSTTSNLKFLDDAGTSYDLLTPLTSGTGATDIDGLSDAIASSSVVFLGSSSGQVNSGNTNSTGLGVWALKSNTSGNSNTAIGYKGLALNTTGAGNTASGAYTLYTNTTGAENTAIGDTSLYYNTTGSYNTATGSFALYNTTIGKRLTGLGSYAGYSGTSHTNGVYLGYKAGYANTTGNNNIAIGFQAGDNVTTGSKNITIGYDIDAVSATGSSQLNIGNTIYGNISTGNIGIGKTSPGATLDVNGTVNATGYSGAGLTSCSGATSKLLWNSSTKNFACGNDQGWILLDTQTASSSSAINFTTGIDSTYDEYVIEFTSVIPATNSTNLTMQISTDGGSTYKQGGSDYAYVATQAYPGAVSYYSNSGNSKMIITQALLTTAGQSASGQVHLYSPSNSSLKPLVGFYANQYASLGQFQITGTAQYISAATAYNAIRFLMSSGNISSGTFSLYGIQKNAGADVAEQYYYNGDLATTPLPGTVVRIDPAHVGHIQVSQGSHDPFMIGIVSTKPGLRLSNTDDYIGGSPVDVALSGRVPVKVSTENGPIKAGDWITSSSVPGVAMKASKAGKVLGQALDSYSGNGVGMLTLFINNTMYAGDPTSVADTNAMQTQISKLTKQLAEQATIIDRLQKLFDTQF